MKLQDLLIPYLANWVPFNLFSDSSFDPRAYPLHTATCKAVDRSGAKPVSVDIQIEYANINPSTSASPHNNKTLVLVHGWPSLWSTWSNQILEFGNEYHLLVPNVRGFGGSTFPGENGTSAGEAVQNSGTLDDMVGDVACVMAHAGVEEAVCVGHDWGAEVCYEAARARPDIFTAVAGAAVPYMPSAGPFTPIAAYVQAFPRFAYQVYFSSETAKAIAELNTDIRRTLRATFRSVASSPPETFLESNTSYLAAYGDAQIPPIPFMSAREENYLVEAYQKQKFNYTLQFYTTPNREESWKFANTQGNFTIPQPALSILPTEDPVANWTSVALLLNSAEFLPKLRQQTINAAHWLQLEAPEEFNAILRDWLQKLDGPGKVVQRAHAEL